ncbi:type II toxin-antitoxin system RelE/ParE family toxin [Sphingomonas sp. Leaf357]|uniref:type II toxin-antitoxin system RelE/ParE family toxin n=1 Tax=Sphingomonas sp. Leaf357 TaxID=1736350 RepID=UPI001F33CA40|nr:type II toxin-antitoxin system RelE/ParE family toxin [Sphingomonas sp. Leaf357]
MTPEPVQLIWLPEARRELRHIIQYISERNVDAADRLEQRIDYSAEMLRNAPHIHRPGRVGGTR